MWTTEQEHALRRVKDWLEFQDDPIFRLFGYAGTGKTTLAKALVEDVKGPVYFCAYTGKAASVLRKKGCPNATTIHSLIYHPKDKSRQHLKQLEQDLIALNKQDEFYDEKLAKIKKEIELERANLARPSFSLNMESDIREAALIVVDEASMVGNREGADLCSFGVPVLVLGDPAQLPPVADTGYFTNNHRPDFLLEEIHRQARDNPILQLATEVRNGNKLGLCDYGAARVMDKEDLQRADYMDADTCLVGRNLTRNALNARYRLSLGMPKNELQPGDKIVCRKNDHEYGLLNGTCWYVTSIDSLGFDQSVIHIVPEENREATPMEVIVHMHGFQGRLDELGPHSWKEAQLFEFGYAMTGHMSQGSQWDNVLVMDESFCFRQDRHKWLYTAITRAAEKLTVARV